MAELQAATCRSCRAPIVWIEMAASGKRMPLDAKPVSAVVLDSAGKGSVAQTYTSHFVTCPNAQAHRKAR